MNGAADSALSPDRPWPGMRPYRENDADYFFGRDAEIADLLARTERSLLTLLYARGGLGKTSLVRAGLSPRLIERGYLPVYLRPRALLDAGRDPVAEVISAIEAAAAEGRIEATAKFAVSTLWELFHREAFDLWDATNRIVTPVLMLDQFEEIFQIIDDDASAAPRVKALLDNLAELVENRLPSRLSMGELPADEDHRFDIASKDYRVILSFREDYLPQVRKLRTIFPSVVENHVRLEPLSGQQALAVIERAGQNLVDHDAATMVIRAVGRRAGLLQILLEPAAPEATDSSDSVARLEVDPAVLSVVCFYLNAERQKRAQSKIDVGLVKLKKPEDIFAEYYQMAIVRVPAEARRFIESSLITSGGERVLYPMKAVDTQGPALALAMRTLLDHGILRKEWLAGEQRLEISHDLLLRPIIQAAAESRAAATRRRRRVRILIVALVILAAGAALWRDRYKTLMAELDQRETLNEALLVAYVPLKSGDQDPEELRNEMAKLIMAADEKTEGKLGVAALKNIFDKMKEIESEPSLHPITKRRLREVAVDYVQLKIDRGRFAGNELDALLRELRETIRESCEAGFAFHGDRSVRWLTKYGDAPVQCQ
jgi:hypothetical protein